MGIEIKTKKITKMNFTEKYILKFRFDTEENKNTNNNKNVG